MLSADCQLWKRNLPQNCGMFGSRSRGNVPRLAMPGLVRQHREGDGLFGLGGDAKVVAELKLESQGREALLDHAHKRRVLCSPAGDDELLEGVAAQNEAPQGILNRSCGQSSSCGHDIFISGGKFFQSSE